MKRIESPSKRWTGYVLLHDPLTYPQVTAIEEAQEKAVELQPSKLLSVVDDKGVITKEIFWTRQTDILRLDAVCKCVAEWHLDGIEQPTPETFPFTPRKDAHALVDWLWDEVYRIYEGESDIPNAS